jgi:hypothetical protein
MEIQKRVRTMMEMVDVTIPSADIVANGVFELASLPEGATVVGANISYTAFTAGTVSLGLVSDATLFLNANATDLAVANGLYHSNKMEKLLKSEKMIATFGATITVPADVVVRVMYFLPTSVSRDY